MGVDVSENNNKPQNGTSTKTQNNIRRPLPEKQFLARNSVLTDLLQDKHIKNIYYMCCATLMALFINTIAYDILYNKEFSIGHKTLFASFKDFHKVMSLWCVISSINFCIYPALRIWAKGYLLMLPKSNVLRYWNYACLSLVMIYYLLSFYLVVVLTLLFDLTIVGTIILACEQIRLIMKTHAFLRENSKKVLEYKPHSDKQLKMASMSTYVDFLFIPTLVFKETYPRKKYISIKFVLINFMEFLGALFLISFIFEKHFVPVCIRFQASEYHWTEIVWNIMSNTLPALGIAICSFYCLLHAWMNGFAELTKFGDREFYQDWWTATTYSEYYRKWNIVVHDWLYTYIYKDFYETVTPKNKTMAKMMVFLISAIVHEYILSLCMRMFFPVLFLEFFGIGVLLYFVSNSGGPILTILFTYGYALGMSISISFYTMEYCVRDNDCAGNLNHSFYKPYLFTKPCIQY